MDEKELLKRIVHTYITGTHGSLPEINYHNINSILSDDFEFKNEEQIHSKSQLMGSVFPGWSSIIAGRSSVHIHSIAVDGRRVLAHWETDYDCCSGVVWYGTDVDISGKQVRGFQVFASFEIDSADKISKIVQRSDTVVKHMGIEEQVRIYRAERTGI